MAITFVGSDSGAQGANQTGITLTLPTHTTDDFGIIYGRSDEAGTVAVLSISSATGWTLLDNQNPTTGRDRVEYVWYKKFTSASETDPVMDTDTSEEHSASVHVFRGVDTVTPFDATFQFDSGSNDATPVNAPITTVNANACLVLFHGATHNDITVAGLPTTPSSMTLGEVVLSADNNHAGQYTGYKLDLGAAATITPTAWTHTASPADTAEWSVYTIALRLLSTAPTITDVETDEDYDDKDTAITITGTNFEASQGTGKVEMGDDPDYGTANLVEQTVTSWGATAIDFTADLDTQDPGTKYLFVTNDSAELNDPGFAVTVHRANAFVISASVNITAGGEATTAQLTAPATKTTGDFDTGRMWDDENGSDSIDITEDNYTELEWCMKATDESNALAYNFRVVLNDGTVLDTYTVSPQLTIISALAGILYRHPIEPFRHNLTR